MDEIKKIFIDGEIVYLKRDSDGWRNVYPFRNIDGTINWKHLIAGRSWKNLFWILVFILILSGMWYEYSHNLKKCSEVMTEYNIIRQGLSDLPTIQETKTFRISKLNLHRLNLSFENEKT